MNKILFILIAGLLFSLSAWGFIATCNSLDSRITELENRNFINIHFIKESK